VRVELPITKCEAGFATYVEPPAVKAGAVVGEFAGELPGTTTVAPFPDPTGAEFPFPEPDAVLAAVVGPVGLPPAGFPVADEPVLPGFPTAEMLADVVPVLPPTEVVPELPGFPPPELPGEVVPEPPWFPPPGFPPAAPPEAVVDVDEVVEVEVGGTYCEVEDDVEVVVVVGPSLVVVPTLP